VCERSTHAASTPKTTKNLRCRASEIFAAVEELVNLLRKQKHTSRLFARQFDEASARLVLQHILYLRRAAHRAEGDGPEDQRRLARKQTVELPNRGPGVRRKHWQDVLRVEADGEPRRAEAQEHESVVQREELLAEGLRRVGWEDRKVAPEAEPHAEDDKNDESRVVHDREQPE